MSKSKQDLYNKMLVNLSQRIGVGELEAMKFMMEPAPDDKRACIPRRLLCQIHTVQNLFQEMSDREIIKPDDIEILEHMIRACASNRKVLVDIIKDYKITVEGGHPNQELLLRKIGSKSSGQIGEDLKNSHAFEIVIRSLGRNWKDLAKSLGLHASDINEIEEKYRGQLKEQSRECLYTWVDMNYGRVNINGLVRALRSCQLNMMAHNVESCSEYKK